MGGAFFQGFRRTRWEGGALGYIRHHAGIVVGNRDWSVSRRECCRGVMPGAPVIYRGGITKKAGNALFCKMFAR